MVDSQIDRTNPQGETAGRPQALVVDDSRTGRRIIETLLTFLGFDVVEAATIDGALAAVEKNCFALITVDRVLDKEDGVELVAKLRASPHCGEVARIVALTGHVGNEHQDAFFDAGADAYLAKPFTVRDLAEILAVFGFEIAPANQMRVAA